MKLKIFKLCRDIVFKSVIVLAFALLYCEFGVYYAVIGKCSWPQWEPYGVDESPSKDGVVKVMFLADTHLLGPFGGHWFDKLRREWQMRRAFQTAITLFEPEAVFFLGDLFDEGQWVSVHGFEEYVKRFNDMFATPSTIKSFVVAGNHDMGFHYMIRPDLNDRFQKAFKTKSVQLVMLKDTNFVLINSMAMEGDECFLCAAAEKRLNIIANRLECDKYPNDNLNCSKIKSNRTYSKPILLQHYPLFRTSDEQCEGEDSLQGPEKFATFRERMDCLSYDSSQYLLKTINPRLIMSGHTHHYCLVKHYISVNQDAIPEYSIPSFNWRNRNDPSFFLGLFSKDEYQLSKCYMPKESKVQVAYLIALFILLIWLVCPFNLLVKYALKKYYQKSL